MTEIKVEIWHYVSLLFTEIMLTDNHGLEYVKKRFLIRNYTKVHQYLKKNCKFGEDFL